jgi:hypothetical protein
MGELASPALVLSATQACCEPDNPRPSASAPTGTLPSHEVAGIRFVDLAGGSRAHSTAA